MNPILHNDGGQFRYSDFVGYIPDFLKSEDDVVELLQIMSDYLNNAYRNIETVEKFEFLFVSIESNLTKTQSTVQKIIDMFKYSSSRSQNILLLSLPRNNAISNTVGKYYGIVKCSGSYSDTLPLKLAEDQISASYLTNGNIVYVKFSIGDVLEYPYKIDTNQNLLIADDMATSQDPFTNSINIVNPSENNDSLSPRIVSFYADDISDIGVRQVSNVDGIIFYNVYFSAKITNVESIASTQLISRDLDGFKVDNSYTNETIYLDYYGFNYSKTQKETCDSDLYTYIRFSDTNGFDWIDNYPCGIFYFREASKTGSITASSINYSEIDPIYDSSCSRWNVKHIYKAYGVIVKFTLSSTCTLTEGDTFYFISKNEIYSTLFNEYTIISVLDDTVTATCTDTNIYSYEINSDVLNSILYTVPLYYSKSNTDLSKITAKVQWNNMYNANTVKTNDVFYCCNTINNERLITIDASSIKTNTLNIFIPISSGLINGDLIYIETTYENQILPIINQKPSKIEYRKRANGYYYEENGCYLAKLINLSTDDINNNFSSSCGAYNIVKINSGVVYINQDILSGTETTGFSQLKGHFINIPVIGDLIYFEGLNCNINTTDNRICSSVVPNDSIDKCYLIETVTYIDSTDEYIITCKDTVFNLPVDINNNIIDYGGYFSICFFEKTGSTFCVGNILNNPSETTGYVSCSTYSGDIFSPKYHVRFNGDDFPLVLTNYFSDITNQYYVYSYKNDSTVIYNKGDFVSYGKYVYIVKNNITVDNNSITPLTSPYFTKYMYPYSYLSYISKYNEFMFGKYSMQSLNYSDTPDYTIGYDSLKNTLFIKKLEDLELKFGWKQHQYLDYKSDMNVENMNRSGYCEIYSNGQDNDIVINDISEFSVATINYPIITHGYAIYNTLKADSILSIRATLTDSSTNTYTITVVCNQPHQFVEGCKVRISGVTVSDSYTSDINMFNTSYNGNYAFDTVSIVNSTTFTYNRIVSGGYAAISMQRICITTNANIVYTRSIYSDISSVVSYIDNNLCLQTYYEHGYKIGDIIHFENLPFSGLDDSYTVTNITNNTFTIHAANLIQTSTEITGYSIYDISINNIVYISSNATGLISGYYKISENDWSLIDNTKLEVPFYIFAKQNIFDITTTNPTYAVGDEININKITYDNSKTVTVLLNSNHDYNENTYITISNVYPREFNGKFKINNIINSKSFTYTVKPNSISSTYGSHVDGYDMVCYSEKWHKYTINSIEWNKVSNYSTMNHGIDVIYTQYVGNSTDTTSSWLRLFLKSVHSFNINDVVVFEKIVDDITTYVTYIVENIISNNIIDVIDISGTVQTEKVSVFGYVYKGVYINNTNTNQYIDNVSIIYGEYSKYLSCISATYNFSDGDLVILNDQILPRTLGMYRVKKDASWIPISKKLVLKANNVSIDLRLNPNYNDVDTDTIKYKYVTYSDIDVSNFIDTNNDSLYIYKVDAPYIRNFNFSKPYVEYIDTTKNGNLDYNSKYDYNSIVPRNDMSSDFTGIPDMKYPLIEKIERLAYLRDPSVIDIDLIGYLARFMGYDITAVKQDIENSLVYNNENEKQLAIRETIENLPQYYELSGTMPGLNMLLSTFGIVADIITLWTKTTNPYNELIEEDDVISREQYDINNGKIGNWVPTSHIKVKIPIEGNFDNLLVDTTDIKNIKKQIRVFKPINVVFDGLYTYLKTTLTCDIGLTANNAKSYMYFSVGYDNNSYTSDGTTYDRDYTIDYEYDDNIDNNVF